MERAAHHRLGRSVLVGYLHRVGKTLEHPAGKPRLQVLPSDDQSPDARAGHVGLQEKGQV